MSEPKPYNSREDQAKAEVGATAISPAAARWAVGLLLLTIVAVPLIDQAGGSSGGWRVWSQWSLRGDMGRSLREFEDRLERQSTVGTAVRPVVQSVLTNVLRTGNEKVVCGRDGWLFYEPDIRFVAGWGFLDPAPPDSAWLRRRQLQAERHTDPIRAILHFRDQLAARGIELVIVPVPAKTMVQPGMLRAGLNGPLANASYARFKTELESRGVLVCDVTQDLAEAVRQGKDQYLATDTHWRPEALALTAQRIAAFVTARTTLPQSLGIEYSRRSLPASHIGDLAAMLPTLKSWPEEKVTIQQVLAPDGSPWTPGTDAQILWLGDSFSNIYSAAEMGFGSAGGLAEQVSFYLGRPLDALRRNDEGAFVTRQALADELASGRDRLAGKKLVIWQFAARELSLGDWRLIELKYAPPPPRTIRGFLVPPAGEQWVISGTVAAQGIVPRPDTSAYREHILAVHLTDVTVAGRTGPVGEAVVYLRSMIDGKLTPAAGLKVGQRVTLSVRDWSEVARLYEVIRRSDLPQAELRAQTACWGELVK